MQRPTWDEYFLSVAEVVKSRSTCLSPAKGAVIVRDNRIISTGYNGTPAGTKNCNEGGCERCRLRKEGKVKSGEALDKCVCVHAEDNAVAQAARSGVSTLGATMYASLFPCSLCAKTIINSGITKLVVYSDDYPYTDLEATKRMFSEANVEVIIKHEGIGSSKPTRLYLAHPLPDRHWVREWELGVEKKLNIELDNPFYDSTERSDVKGIDNGTVTPYSKELDPDFIVTGDLKAIDNAQGTLCFVTPNASVGIYMEVFYNSYVLHKPAYLIITNEKFVTHPWLRYFSKKIFKSTSEFEEWYKNGVEIKG